MRLYCRGTLSNNAKILTMLSQSHQRNQDGGLVMVKAGHSSGQVGSSRYQISAALKPSYPGTTVPPSLPTTTNTTSAIYSGQANVCVQKQTLIFQFAVETKKLE